MIIVSRIVTALIMGLVGYQVGKSANVESLFPNYVDLTIRYSILIVVGAITGFVAGGLLGKLLDRGLKHVGESLRTRTGGELVVGAFGLMVGLAVSLLVSFVVRPLPFAGTYLLLPMTLIIAYVFAELAAVKHVEILRLLGVRLDKTEVPGKLLDTSVLIDGRIGDIVSTGFLEGPLLVPVFVLEELQRVADSSDDLRRARGRRGLDVVQRLRKARLLTTPDVDYHDLDAVDSKLVRLALERNCVVVTTDYNLNKVAQIQQVRVLNINELANAMKPEFVPGERLEIKIIKEGKETGQGVGYLDDGTMVVVEDAQGSVGKRVGAEVTSVLQSPSGKLVFARRSAGEASADAGSVVGKATDGGGAPARGAGG